MSLPRSRWWTVTVDGSSWDDTTEHLTANGAAAGHLLVPGDICASDSDLLMVDAGIPRAKTAGERRAEIAPAKLAAIYSHRDTLLESGFTFEGAMFTLSQSDAVRLAHLMICHMLGVAVLPRMVRSADGLTAVVIADQAGLMAYYGAVVGPSMATMEAAETRVQAVQAALANPDATAGLAAVLAVNAAW